MLLLSRHAFGNRTRTTLKPHTGNLRRLRLQGDAADPPNESCGGILNALLDRVASPSLNEIERVIHDLESVREILCTEGERVARNIIDYASLSRASMSAMKVISKCTEQWKDAREQT
jgi:hypothetical protein